MADTGTAARSCELTSQPIVSLRNLEIGFRTDEGMIDAVRDVSLDIGRNKTVALVGESGSGKTVVSHAILGILPKSACLRGGQILFNDPSTVDQTIDLAPISQDDPRRRAIRGGRIAIIFQEPMSSLSPLHTIGDQISESFRLHIDSDRELGRRETIAHAREGRLPASRARVYDQPVRAFGRIAATGDDRDGSGLSSDAVDSR